MKPVIVLIGRPNTGKSTLFNRLTRDRRAIVAGEPGLTRDRQYGEGRVGNVPYWIVDTGGMMDAVSAKGDVARTEILRGQRQQLDLALQEADCILFVVDARQGLHPMDEEIANRLRSLHVPVYLLANKTEGIDEDIAAAEFHQLQIGKPIPISGKEGRGVDALMKKVLVTFPVVEEQSHEDPDKPYVAVVGQPNVGKSTLVNAMLGEDRVITSNHPGTTRDSIQIPFQRKDKHYVFIDTAGVRRRAKSGGDIERYSVLRTLQAIDEANVVLFMIDAKAGVHAQDAGLAGRLLEQGKATVLIVNKWDLLSAAQRREFKDELAYKIQFLDFADLHTISALKGGGLTGIFLSIDRAFTSALTSLSTGELNKALNAAVQQNPPPRVRGRQIRLKYAHQGGKNPPLIVVHGNQTRSLPDSYIRYLSRYFCDFFRLHGTPVRIETRDADNPYVAKK